jgi:hypothetical protein
VTALAVTKDGKKLFSGSLNGSIYLWYKIKKYLYKNSFFIYILKKLFIGIYSHLV